MKSDTLLRLFLWDIMKIRRAFFQFCPNSVLYCLLFGQPSFLCTLTWMTHSPHETNSKKNSEKQRLKLILRRCPFLFIMWRQHVDTRCRSLFYVSLSGSLTVKELLAYHSFYLFHYISLQSSALYRSKKKNKKASLKRSSLFCSRCSLMCTWAHSTKIFSFAYTGFLRNVTRTFKAENHWRYQIGS